MKNSQSLKTSAGQPLLISDGNNDDHGGTVNSPGDGDSISNSAFYKLVPDVIDVIFEYLINDLKLLRSCRLVNRAANKVVSEMPEMAVVILSKLLSMLSAIPHYQSDIRFTKSFCTTPVIVNVELLQTSLVTFLVGKDSNAIAAQFCSMQHFNASESSAEAKKAFKLFVSLCDTVKKKFENHAELILQSNYWKNYLYPKILSSDVLPMMVALVVTLLCIFILLAKENTPSPSSNTITITAASQSSRNNNSPLSFAMLAAALGCGAAAEIYLMTHLIKPMHTRAALGKTGDTCNEQGKRYESFSPTDARMFKSVANFFKTPSRATIVAANNTQQEQQEALTRSSARSE